jgi:D-3-phosphoglycerate dehydrogenase / 2-oxoglutarate reductase
MAQKTFIFDFDSTLFPGESLDEIIQLQLESETESEQKKKEITRICNLGMRGEISMEQSLKQRLDIGAPTAATIKNYIVKNQDRIAPSICNLLKKLQAAGHTVIIISGGFEEWIIPLMDNIVSAENIHANKIADSHEPMHYANIIRRDKETIIASLQQAGRNRYIIGDGATDFSVYQNGLAQAFIGAFYYTGYDKRNTIVQLAKEHKQAVFDQLPNFIEYISSQAALDNL